MMMHEKERGKEREVEREGAWIEEEGRWVDRLSLLIRLSASTTTTTTLSSASSQKSAMSVESVFISVPLTLSLCRSHSLCTSAYPTLYLMVWACPGQWKVIESL